jgi:hypothetical protein
MLDANEDTRIFQQVTAQFDAPAFVRRARSVEVAWERLVFFCQGKRDDLLTIPRLRLAVLLASGGDWEKVGALLAAPAEADGLQELFMRWRPKLRVQVERTESTRVLKRALYQLCESFERFNRKWHRFVSGVDLGEINRLRTDYNRFYVLEKECSVRSAAIAREGFRPLPPLTTCDLFVEFPLLPVPVVGK